MRRAILLTVFFAAIAVAAKLALKPQPASRSSGPPPTSAADATATNHVTTPQPPPAGSDDSELLARFPDERTLVERLLEAYGHNARRIAQSDGLSGLRLLDSLGDAAVCLYDERPQEFRRLCVTIGRSPESARVVAAWQHFFDPKQGEPSAASRLTDELNRLAPRARRLTAELPEALPFLLIEPRRTADLIERLGPDALEPLAFVDLSDGGDSLREALNVLDRHGRLAIEASAEFGPAGLLLVDRYGPLVRDIEPELGMCDSLRVVAAAADDLDELLQTRRAEPLAQAMLHLAGRGLLFDAAATRHAIKLCVEFGETGERAMRSVGPQVAELAYEQCPAGRVRNAAVRAIAEGGVPAAAALAKHIASPGFRRIVERDGTAAILAVAASCSAEEARAYLAQKPDRTWSESLALGALHLSDDSADKTIDLIARDGIDRARYLGSTSIEPYQLLPLYDLTHLGGVLVNGQTPTKGEFVWAGIDAALVAFDAASLLALQPEGIAAGEAARAGAKTAARGAVQSVARAGAEQAAEVASRQLTRSTASLARAAGTAVERESVAAGELLAQRATARWTTSLARRSSIRLAERWMSELVQAASGTFSSVSLHRANKYVVANAVEVGVGVLAIEKMEEYLAGGREREQDTVNKPSPIERHEHHGD